MNERLYKMDILTGCITDKGWYREKNQDRVVCGVKQNESDCLAVGCVCDGIGGFKQSEIAAEMVCKGIEQWFQGMSVLFPDRVDEYSMVEDLDMTIQELNEIVHSYQMEHQIGIGCTMSLFFVVNDRYYVFHVGDSRVYRIGETCVQLTTDESCMMEVGNKIRPILTNFIGKSQTLLVNRLMGELKKKDIFLIATDGMYKFLQENDIRQAVGKPKCNRHVQMACERMRDLVLERGERDNISGIIFYVMSVK